MFRQTKLNWSDLKKTLDDNKIARETVDNQEQEKVHEEQEKQQRKVLVKPSGLNEIEYDIPTVTDGKWGTLSDIQFLDDGVGVILSGKKDGRNVTTKISEAIYEFLNNKSTNLDNTEISELKNLWTEYGQKKATLKVKEPVSKTINYAKSYEVDSPTERLLPHTINDDLSEAAYDPLFDSNYEQPDVDDNFWEGRGVRKMPRRATIAPIYYSDAESLSHELKRHLGSWMVGNENCLPYIRSILQEMYKREYIDLEDIHKIKVKYGF
jgi:peptidyl-tRNA hydrolase